MNCRNESAAILREGQTPLNGFLRIDAALADATDTLLPASESPRLDAELLLSRYSMKKAIPSPIPSPTTPPRIKFKITIGFAGFGFGSAVSWMRIGVLVMFMSTFF